MENLTDLDYATLLQNYVHSPARQPLEARLQTAKAYRKGGHLDTWGRVSMAECRLGWSRA